MISLNVGADIQLPEMFVSRVKEEEVVKGCPHMVAMYIEALRMCTQEGSRIALRVQSDDWRITFAVTDDEGREKIITLALPIFRGDLYFATLVMNDDVDHMGKLVHGMVHIVLAPEPGKQMFEDGAAESIFRAADGFIRSEDALPTEYQ